MKKMISFLLVVLLCACATSKPTLYEPMAVQSVKIWSVSFTYDSGQSETTVSSQKGTELKVVNTGRPASELKLRDDIAFLLRDTYKINTSRMPRKDAGEIRINPVSFRSGGFSSIDIEIILPNGEIGGRIALVNGDRNATYKNEIDFAEFSAKSIASALTGKN